MSDCPFCLATNAANNALESALLLSGEHCYIAANPHPVLAQASLVIPYRHVETPFEMSEAELLEAMTLMKRAKILLDKAQPDGYTIGWNVGAVGGQEVIHAHLHVIARFADEPLAGQGLRYHLKQPHNRRPGV